VNEHVQHVGSFDILSPIGRGGMGCVYRGRIEGPAGASKDVAIKLVHAHLSSNESFITMFLDEMRVAMAMAHRNIVHTFQAGQVDQRYFMVMELVEGSSLRQLLDCMRGAPFPLDLAIFVATEICAALDYAHALTPPVVHRDVSPANILLSLQGDVKLTDFGIAKVAGRLFVTSEDILLGKRGYMAPEQARGAAEAGSDIFSVGAVLYELLCGQPFRKNPDLDELRLASRPIRPPSSLRPDVPPALEQLVLQCLSPDPERRPRGANELRQTLAEESFRLQLRGNGNLDPHGRLTQLLQAHLPSATRADGVGDEAQLARAVLKAALEVEADSRGSLTTWLETAHHALPAEETTLPPTAPPPQPGLSRPAGRPAEQRPPRRTMLVLAALLLLFGVGILVGLLGTRREASFQERPPQVAASPVPDVRLPTDLAVAATRPQASAPDAAAPDASTPASGPETVRKLRREPRPGFLHLNSVPWAKIYIDGRPRGETPIQGLRLAPGLHQVRLVNPARGLSHTGTVRIRSGQTSSEVIYLR
jgi:serine/threonine-protein kinase